MLRQKLSAWILRRFGWQIVGELPQVPQCVFIFAPHTSNWDFVIMYLTKVAMGVQVNFLGKHQLFRFPYGWFFRWLGGIPVVRHEHHNVVQANIQAFRDNPHLKLALAPEGTRRKTDHWRTGFYHIAVGAGVPIQCAFLDARSKRLGLGPLIQPTGDLERDFAALRAFYSQQQGIVPALASDIRPRSENR